MSSLKVVTISLAAALAVATPTYARAQSSNTVVILVRHAEKAAEPGTDPALSAAGEARARALADAFQSTKIAAVLTTPFKRTIATAAPLAKAEGVTPVVVPVNAGVPAYARSVADMVRNDYAGRAVVIVGHSNTIPAVITALGGPTVNDLCENEYSTVYTLTLNGSATPKLEATHYGVPDAAGASGCRTMSMPLNRPRG